MNPHIAKAYYDYTAKNHNFEQLLDWHLCNGFVFCQPECFGMGYFSDSSNPEFPVERHHADTLFVTYCSGHMQPILGVFNNQFDYVAFKRDFNGSSRIRLWDYDKTFNRIK